MSASQMVSVSCRRWKEAQPILEGEVSGIDDAQSWSFSTNSRSMLWRNGEQISELREGKPLVRWHPGQTGLEVAPAKAGGSSAPWVVVRDLTRSQAKLAAGDTMQLGRETLYVRQLSMTDAQLDPALLGASCMQCEESSEEQCRICLMEGCSAEDPFVKPCACTGSIAKVHLGCLRQWAQTKQSLPEQSVEQQCSFQQPFCEMCKVAYPVRVERGDRTEALLEMPSVTGPFLVLESAGKGKNAAGQPRRSAFHVVSFADNELANIGRGRECRVRLDEGSMSRCHASIRFEDGEFYIQDHQSKFGTLLRMRDSWTLAPGETLPIKVGSTVLSIGLSEMQSFESCLEPSYGSGNSNDDSASEDDKSDVEVFSI